MLFVQKATAQADTSAVANTKDSCIRKDTPILFSTAPFMINNSIDNYKEVFDSYDKQTKGLRDEQGLKMGAAVTERSRM